MKGSLFFLQLLFLINLGYAQNENLYPFYNYDTTLMGLKGYLKTYITPTYDTIYPLNGRYYTLNKDIKYFIVRKNDRYGLVTGYGETIIPIDHDSLVQTYQDFVQFFTKDKWGLCNLKNEIVLQPIYQSFTFNPKSDSFFFYQQNDLFGIMDFNFRIITPPRFQALDYLFTEPYGDGRIYYCSDHLVYATENGKNGVYDLKRNIFISAETQSYIAIKFHDPYDPTSEANYRFQDNPHGEMIYNTEGQLVFSSDSAIYYLSFYYYRPFNALYYDYQDSVTEEYLLVWYDNNQKAVYNLKNGHRSKVYGELKHFYDQFIFVDSLRWGILDSEFNEIFVSDQFLPGDRDNSIRYIHKNPITYFPEFEPNQNWCTPVDQSIIFYCKPSETLTNSASNNYQYYTYRSGLLNYKTGKRTLPIYDEFNSIVGETDTLFYGYAYVEVDHKKKLDYIDIYDQNFKKIKRLQLSEIAEINRFTAFSGNNFEKLIFVKNKEGKLGAINGYGKTMIPFKFNSVSGIEACQSWVGQNFLYYALENDDKRSLYDLHGNLLLPGIYDNFYTLQDTSLVATNNKLFFWYDKSLNLIVDSCSYISYYNNYYVKNNKLYQCVDNEHVTFNESNTIFESNTAVVGSVYLINRAGEVLYIASSGIAKDAKGYYSHKEHGYYYRISETGKATIVSTLD